MTAWRGPGTLGVLLSLLPASLPGLCPGARGAQEAQQGEGAATDAAAAFAALLAEHAASELSYPEQAAAFGPRFRQFADEHPGTPEALRALFQLFGDCWWKRSESEDAMHAAANVVAEEILAKYADADGLVEFTSRAYVLDAEQKERIFGRLAKSEKPLLAASGILGLARTAKGEAATALYRRLLEEFPSVRYQHTTMGRLADAVLHRHSAEDLAVGKVAPDIEGEDVDGVAFRLSDYRGKVVVLDFWGDW